MRLATESKSRCAAVCGVRRVPVPTPRDTAPSSARTCSASSWPPTSSSACNTLSSEREPCHAAPSQPPPPTPRCPQQPSTSWPR
eukprot:5608841-Prymnesium_polylepis.1